MGDALGIDLLWTDRDALGEVTRPSRPRAGPVPPVPTPEQPPWGMGRQPFDAGAQPALIKGGRARVSQEQRALHCPLPGPTLGL